MMPGMRRVWQAVACAAFLAAPLGCAAASFSVIPVRIYFAPRDRAVAVTLTNAGDSPVALQAELYDWQQAADGSDKLIPTDDLVLAPTVIRLAARSQQVVRLALLRAPDPQRQLAYRMIIREVPELTPGSEGLAVPVALALSLPVFVTPSGARSQVECQPLREVQALQLQCANRGNAVALLRTARLERGAAVQARFDGAAYLLPGAGRRISLDILSGAEVPPGPARLVLTLDDDVSYTQEVLLLSPNRN